MVRYGLGQDLHENGDNDVLEQWDSVFAPAARRLLGGRRRAPEGHPLQGPRRGDARPDGSMSGLLKWQHFQGFSTVDIDGDRTVTRTQHLHTHKGDTDGQGWNLIQTGFLVDRLERRAEGWRIAHRTLEIIWMGTFATV
ncbi:nuclear transport factor 2 family protein [Streptomyces venezuelae]|uniref:Nuclear transport factor 2 family protein n=2 Tax=Streptomyces venezuelae TaxID=54571 RepID=A0A5P2C865_STRVZ|nr:nuclear transport factor 2 family protein [Streptomyces venezuelae]